MAKVTPAMPEMAFPCSFTAVPEKFTQRGTVAEEVGACCWASPEPANIKSARNVASEYPGRSMALSSIRFSFSWFRPECAAYVACIGVLYAIAPPLAVLLFMFLELVANNEDAAKSVNRGRITAAAKGAPWRQTQPRSKAQ